MRRFVSRWMVSWAALVLWLTIAACLVLANPGPAMAIFALFVNTPVSMALAVWAMSAPE